MGTRNLTAVFIDGEYKVAQYGQWDGYPGGQGMTALHFLRDEMEEERFKDAVRKSVFIDPKELWKLQMSYGMSEDGLMTLTDDASLLSPLRFLREREIVHFQRFGECLEILQNM